MKKSLKNLAISFVALSVISSLQVFAAETLEATLNVQSTISKDVAPDTAKIRFYVNNSGINLAEIKEKNDKIVNSAINAIKSKLGSNETITTIAFSIDKVYSYKDKVRIFQKYEVRNGFEVKLKDLSKVSQIIQIATDNNVKSVDRLDFYIENGENICTSLMAESIKQAKSRASILANAAGVSLDRPKSINPYCSLQSNFVQPRYYANAMMDSVSSKEAGGVIESIEPGQMNVKANVNMTYYLK